MKKKGLIISTIVMVVVLIASLTTATYAWFNTSNVTKIDAFNVQVVSNNLVKIGFKNNFTYESSAGENAFRTGTVTFSGATNGTVGTGNWNGSNGLSATISHNIAWGSQSQAVGFTNTAIANKYLDPEDAEYTTPTVSNTGIGTLDASHKTYAYAANGDGIASNTELSNLGVAIANTNGASGSSAKSDYVHFILGAAPTKALASNELIILLNANGSTSTTLGILSAVHVAYRLNSSGEWNNVDLFAHDEYVEDATATNEAGHYSYSAGVYTELDGNGDTPAKTYSKVALAGHETTLIDDVPTALTDAEKATWKSTYAPGDEEDPIQAKGVAVLKIPGLKTGVNQIDQIEILIYMDGMDGDCLTSAVGNMSGAINIFFHAVPLS